MSEIAWGPSEDGVRFGLEKPEGELEAGGAVTIGLVAESIAREPVLLFGFAQRYPRSLRFSPPKADRPWVRVSFGDTNVLHDPAAFTKLLPGQRLRTVLDLSFAFDRRGAGRYAIAFAYDPVRGVAGMRTFERALATGVVELEIGSSRALRASGVDIGLEQQLDDALVRGEPTLVERLRALPGGALWAARRVARTMASGAEAAAGWRALEALALLGERGIEAARATIADVPHAAPALELAIAWTSHRLGRPPEPAHLAFVTALDEVVTTPDRRGNFALSWTPYDSPMHGSMHMDVFAAGERIVVSRARGATVPASRRTMLPAPHLQALLDSLRWSGAWLLVPLRAAGLPDEPRPALSVRLAIGTPFERRVALWNGEWRQGPAAQLADLLDRLAAEGAG